MVAAHAERVPHLLRELGAVERAAAEREVGHALMDLVRWALRRAHVPAVIRTVRPGERPVDVEDTEAL